MSAYMESQIVQGKYQFKEKEKKDEVCMKKLILLVFIFFSTSANASWNTDHPINACKNYEECKEACNEDNRGSYDNSLQINSCAKMIDFHLEKIEADKK